MGHLVDMKQPSQPPTLLRRLGDAVGCSDGTVGDKFLYLIAGTRKSGNAAFIK